MVRTGLKLAHGLDLVDVSPPEGVQARCFRLPELAGAWASARNDGLVHPVTGRERPVTFDPDAVVGRTDLVLLHLKHRLVDLCLTLLRRELWSQGSATQRLSRVTARVVESDILRVPAVVAHGRVVITGAEGSRLHEEVLVAGGRVEEGRFTRVKESDVESWLAAASTDPVPAPLRDRLAGMWPGLAPSVSGALRARATQRAKSLDTTLAQRRDAEVEAIQAVLDELAASIRASLEDTPPCEQPSLFDVTDGERTQMRRDHEALSRRLEEIPRRKEDEVAALRRRYADPAPRWFPAAVTFLVPASLARREG